MARNDASGPNRAASVGVTARSDASGPNRAASVGVTARNDVSALTSMASDGVTARNDASGLTSMAIVDAVARSGGGSRAVTAVSAPSGTAVDAVVVGSAAAASGRGDHATMAAG